MGCTSSKHLTHTVHTSSHPEYPKRASVKNVPWSVPEPGYKPVEFTSPKVLAADRSKDSDGWADPAEWTPKLRAEVGQRITNALAKPSRVKIVNGKPRNPVGRTGLTGRGLLGLYGPNQAADALITRKSETGATEIVVIKRGDVGAWALPGGMINRKDTAKQTAAREFLEEAVDKLNTPQEVMNKLEALLKNGTIGWVGYVDDPRNTDISWMETTCIHYHMEDKDLAIGLKLKAGDDAVDVKWIEFGDNDDFNQLYANHCQLVRSIIR